MSVPRVLLVTPLPPPVGGIATWSTEVLAASRCMDIAEVAIVNSAVLDRDINASSLIQKVLLGGRHGIRLLLSVLKSIRSGCFDVLHLCTAGEIGLIRDCVIICICRMFSVPVVLHLHRGKVPDYPILMKTVRLEAVLTRLAVRLANQTIVLNSPALESISHKVNASIEVVPNFISISTRNIHDRDADPDIPTLIFVGGVISRKGVEDLVDVCIRLHESVKFRLLLVGPVSDEMKISLLDAVMSRSQDQNWIEFSGAVSKEEVSRLMDESDAFCLPSYAEGQPYVILEAMAKGLPIVSTNVGAISWMLRDGAGVCIEPGDKDALYANLHRVLTDPEFRRVIGSSAASRCRKEYSNVAVFPLLVDLWNRSRNACCAKDAIS